MAVVQYCATAFLYNALVKLNSEKILKVLSEIVGNDI